MMFQEIILSSNLDVWGQHTDNVGNEVAEEVTISVFTFSFQKAQTPLYCIEMFIFIFTASHLFREAFPFSILSCMYQYMAQIGSYSMHI